MAGQDIESFAVSNPIANSEKYSDKPVAEMVENVIGLTEEEVRAGANDHYSSGVAKNFDLEHEDQEKDR